MIGLTDEQEKFCAAYVRSFNASAAAKECGRKPPWATNQLRNSMVRRRIRELRDEVLCRQDVTESKIITEIAKLAFSSIDDLLEFDDDGVTIRSSLNGIPPEALATVREIRNIRRRSADGSESVDVQLKMYDKLRALEMLARVMSMFNDSVDHRHTFDWADLARKAESE